MQLTASAAKEPFPATDGDHVDDDDDAFLTDPLSRTAVNKTNYGGIEPQQEQEKEEG